MSGWEGSSAAPIVMEELARCTPGPETSRPGTALSSCREIHLLIKSGIVLSDREPWSRGHASAGHRAWGAGWGDTAVQTGVQRSARTDAAGSFLFSDKAGRERGR